MDSYIELLHAQMLPVQRRRHKMYMGGLTFQEIAEIEGVLYEAVRQMVRRSESRAKKKLKKIGKKIP